MASPAPSLTPDQLETALQKLLNGPADIPPAGIIPYFKNPPNLAILLDVTVGLTVGFATCAVIIRIYTKHFLLRSMGYEDYTSIIAWMSFIGFAVPSVMCHKAGVGTHMWDIQLKSFFRVLYWVNVVAITYAITITFVKLSILLQYLRIFAPSRKVDLPLFLAIHACIWSLVIFYVVDTFFLIFLCTPREKIWNPLMTTGHCFNGSASYKASGVFNILSDFAMLILPMPVLWNLQMSLKRKLLTTGIFATGFFACVTSILRSYYTWRVVETRDISWDLLFMGLWTWAELSTGIIIGCLPALPKFFQHIGPKIHQITIGTGSGPESSAASNAPNGNVLAKVKRPFAKYGIEPSVCDPWSEPYGASAQLHGEYVSLDGIDASMSQAFRESTACPGQGIATVRNDLEYGEQKP